MELEVVPVATEAEKRASYAHNVPFSLSILKPVNYYSPLLNSLNLVDQRVSGLVITEFNRETPQIYIRGVGSNVSGSGDDPSVAFMVNGVSVARPGFHNAPLFDVKQIEVMKGPQGTLYGKGVIGGAVNVILNKPDHDDYDHLSVAVDERGWGLQHISNHQMAGPWANRLSLSYDYDQGYLENAVTGGRTGAVEELTVRDQLAWSDSRQQLGILVQYDHLDALDPARMYVGDPPYSADLTPYANNWDTVAVPMDGYSQRDMYTLLVNYELAESYGTWVSHTAWIGGDYEFALPVNPIDFMVSVNSAEDQSWQFSQEIRLQQQWQDWSWQTGVYVSRERTRRRELGDLTGLTELLGAGGLLTPQTPGITDYDSRCDVLNGAAFGQATWQFAPAWSLDLGLRADYVKKDFDLSVTGGDPFNIGLANSADFAIAADESWREPSYSLALKHDLSEELMLYGRAATGFKSGSFNNLATSPESALASSEPESAMTAELGWKGRFFERALQLNGAVFRTDYDRLQVYSGLESGTNAPQARIQGAELDFKAKLGQGFEWEGNYTYLDSTYEYFLSPSAAQDFSGNRLTRAPLHEVALRFNYSWQDGASNRYRLELEGNYTSEYAIVPKGDDSDRIPDRTVSNAALYVQHAGGGAVLSLWVRNLFNEHYPVHAFGQEVFFYTPRGSAWNLAEPRTLGTTMTWQL